MKDPRTPAEMAKPLVNITEDEAKKLWANYLAAWPKVAEYFSAMQQLSSAEVLGE